MPDTATVTPELLTHPQAAALCGLSLRHWHALAASGRVGPLPRRLGGSVRFSRTELSDWIAAGCPSRVEWLKRVR